MRFTGLLNTPKQAHALMTALFQQVKPALQNGQNLTIEIKSARRSLDQNARMWALLTDISRQVQWYGKHLTAEDWKHVFSASMRKLDVVPNLDGTGFVALGLSTSSMTVREMAELMELIEAFGAQREVRWSHEEQPAMETA